MIDQETTDKLLAMRLRTMAEVFRELSASRPATSRSRRKLA
jgi:hypothetical protein